MTLARAIRSTRVRGGRSTAWIAALCALAILSGCSGGGGGGGGTLVPGTPLIAPQGLDYAMPPSVVVGVPIVPVVPTLVDGTADGYAVSPNLPPGLLFDATTGVISGTPLVPAGAVLYTVTATNAAGSDSTSFVLSVLPAPAIPTVGFVDAASSVDESAVGTELALALSAAAPSDVTVPFTVLAGSATPGVDLDLAAGSVVIAAGDLTTSIAVLLIDDSTDEPDETVTVVLGAPSGATLSANTDHVLTIVDDDPTPAVSFAVAALSLPETPGTTDLAVSLDRPSSSVLSATVSVGGSAQPGVDYALATTTLDFPAGTTDAVLPFEILGDDLFEGDETAVLTLVPDPGLDAGTPATIEVTIGEDEPPPTVELSGGGATVEEGSGPVTLTVGLSTISGVDATVDLGLSGTATAGADYPAPPGSVTIVAGSLTADVVIDPSVDALVEGPETATVTLVGAANATIGVEDTATVTIDDPFVPPTPTVELSGGGTAVEGAGPVALTVTLSTTAAVDVEVTFSLAGTATAGSDYPSPASPVTIPAGALTGTIEIDPVDDGAAEGPESVEVTLDGATGANLGAMTAATVTIEDPSTALPEVTITGGTSMEEGTGPVNLQVTLSEVSPVPVTVTLEITGSATAGVDYAAPANPVTIPAGVLSVPVSIEPIDDGVVEGTESVVVTLLSATSATIGSVDTATVLVDDPGVVLPVVTIGGLTSTVEGNGPANLLVSMSALSADPVTVTVDLSGTATPGVDYPTPANPLTIPAGALTVPIPIVALDDGIAEGAETVVATIVSAVNADIGTPDTTTMTIQDIAAPVPTVTIAPGGTVLEAGAPLAIAVTLSAPTTGPVEVEFSLGGTATPVTDYAVTASPVTIPTGATAASITIDPVVDGVTEGPETIDIALTSATGADLGAAVTSLVTIDEANLPTVELVGGGASGLEGAGPIFLSVELSAPSALPVQVTIAYGGTATNGVDYFATASPLTILPGNTAGSIALDPFPDGFVEGDETVEVTLGGATNAVLGTTTSATLTIIDDVSAPQPPVGLSYSDPVALYAPGLPILDNVPTLASGTADTWSVVPILPIGLAIDPVTGVISGTPSFEQPSNTYTVTAANAVGSTTAAVTIEVRSGFEYSIEDQTVPYLPASGFAAFDVSLLVSEAVGSSTGSASSEIVRLYGGIAFDDSKIGVTDVVWGAGLDALNGGTGPDWFLVNPEPGGVTIAAIISFQSPPADVLIADVPTEWALLSFEAAPGFLQGDLDGETVAIDWDGTLGSSPITNTIVHSEILESQPVLQDGTITFTP